MRNLLTLFAGLFKSKETSTKRTYGWKPMLPDFRDIPYSMKLAPGVVLPKLVDLRPQCPAVYDQGQIGSCTANASAGAYEFDLKKQQLSDFVPSRLFIYYNERVIDKSGSKNDAGSFLRTAAKVLNTVGVCSETDWPYIEAKFSKRAPIACYRTARNHKSVQYAALDNTNITQLKTCLSLGTPFILGFTVYESFESATVAQTGMVPMPGTTEQVLGGHAVMCVGYDDSKQCFIIRNSWGTSWGIQGYCYMPYAYLTNANLASDFWQITTVSA